MSKPFWSAFNPSLRVLGLAGLLTCLHAGESLWQGTERSMIADKKAGHVGDLLTIVVQQNTVASKANNTKTTKQSSVNSSLNSVLFSPGASGFMTKGGQLPSVAFTGKSDFTGGGSIDNSEKIVDQITVRVIDTQPNGNLVVEGTRQTAFGGEIQDVILRGLVRPDDIQPNNTVFSYNVSDATIRMVSKGSVTDTQRKGWLHKVWDKFSPF